MTVAILSDTHFPARGTVLPQPVGEVLGRADLIVHAGDLADLDLLRQLQGFRAPIVAVHGNADDEAVRGLLPPSAEVDLPGLRLGVTHNGGPEAGRLERMRSRFPGCGGVVFGHSHIPLHQVARDGFFILNPGSATDRRRQPRHSMVEMTVREGAPPEVRFLAVDDPPGPLPPELVRTGAP
ncbi:MAG TPA: YfcE family phosphodiesterase [Miltoncostaeaceae bacterium]|nr:YfcE family phosphodiesterase [Miltoncostaeaceae bacterium]